MLDQLTFDTVRQRVFVGADPQVVNGGWFSDDYGLTWTQCTKADTRQLRRMRYNPTFDEVWALSTSGGTNLGTSRSIDGGANWTSSGNLFVAGPAVGSTLGPGGSLWCTDQVAAVRTPRTLNGITATFGSTLPTLNALVRDILYVDDLALWFSTDSTSIFSANNGDSYLLRTALAGGIPQLGYNPDAATVIGVGNNQQKNSLDGFTWVASGAPPPIADPRQLIYSTIHGRFILVGAGASAYTTEGVDNWTARAMPSGAVWGSVVECPL